MANLEPKCNAVIEELVSVLEETLALTKASLLIPRPNNEFDKAFLDQMELARTWIDHALNDHGESGSVIEFDPTKLR
ncbi:MAG: hypothetical protein RIC14_06095 [Filomicrobium sp.]